MTARQTIIGLLADGARTPKEIVEETGLAQRTVYQALVYLRHRGHVKRTPNLLDMRRRVYSLTGGTA